MIFNNVCEFSNLTRTAQEAADQIGCSVAQIAKSIIFRQENDDPVLVITSGVNRVNTEIIEKELGRKIGKADAGYCLKATGYVIGGIPPFGHTSKITTFIDEDLKQYPEIWASAGKTNTVFKTNFQELKERTAGKVIKIK